jgi:hypothetical protein
VYQYCINRYYPCNNWSNGIGTATGLPAGVTAAFALRLQLVVHQLYREHSTILFH